jgi:predicted RNA-binding Zn ribbon-like protein
MDVIAAGADDEVLLLDLLNTTPVIDGTPTDALADFVTAAHWLTDHAVTSTEQEWTALLEARTVLQAIVRGDQPASTLQPILAPAQLVPTASGHGIDWRLTSAAGAVRAALAWDRLRITGPGRLRPCANTECHLFLIDRSKPNTARWCSMAVCGNRMKARRHHSRTSKS